MSIKIKETKELVRIKNKKIELTFLSIQGKEEGVFVEISPTLMVSGYGNTEKEARESFTHNVELFCRDVLELSPTKRDKYLVSLGFKKETYKNKNFSKAYIDDKGVLKNLDSDSVKTSFLEACV